MALGCQLGYLSVVADIIVTEDNEIDVKNDGDNKRIVLIFLRLANDNTYNNYKKIHQEEWYGNQHWEYHYY